ncbi:hypothetical protein NB716_001518 [Pantoea ananatis]|nr:hypothetical protein [Pantoea ananatis]
MADVMSEKKARILMDAGFFMRPDRVPPRATYWASASSRSLKEVTAIARLSAR